MEIKTADPLFSVKTMKGRKAPPSHYTFKIKSFSWLSKASVQQCTSEEFEAGGYKWSLSIYPTGNIKGGGQGHVSIYLVLMDSSSLPVDWEVNAVVNFSAYNFIDDEYVTTQDTNVRRFHVLKTEWGIAKFIDIDIFNDPSNGYLMDDTCVFGAEVFVVKTTNKGDCLSMFHGPITCSHSWKFDRFSYTFLDKYESESFVGGNYKWKLIVYPKGIDEGKGNSISLFLTLEVSTLPLNTKVIVECTLRAKDQISGHHAQTRFCHKFSSSNSTWGSRQLVALAKFEDPNSGFWLNATCIVEAEFTILGLMTPRID
ncbi:Ubiquitin carboxyl-terminal hydrolase 12 [Spatholobus suberectus]|nr:Ubiquitin carboxyl-terminal hydrolase 12 [Spatholobus suberectus]